jgi:H+/Cl- antiporter ClcA
VYGCGCVYVCGCVCACVSLATRRVCAMCYQTLHKLCVLKMFATVTCTVAIIFTLPAILDNTEQVNQVSMHTLGSTRVFHTHVWRFELKVRHTSTHANT